VQVSANFKITNFQTETLICKKCFPDQESLCSLTELAEQIASKTEVQKIFTIFSVSQKLQQKNEDKFETNVAKLIPDESVTSPLLIK